MGSNNFFGQGSSMFGSNLYQMGGFSGGGMNDFGSSMAQANSGGNIIGGDMYLQFLSNNNDQIVKSTKSPKSEKNYTPVDSISEASIIKSISTSNFN
jgi:hypothetical protein